MQSFVFSFAAAAYMTTYDICSLPRSSFIFMLQPFIFLRFTLLHVYGTQDLQRLFFFHKHFNVFRNLVVQQPHSFLKSLFATVL